MVGGEVVIAIFAHPILLTIVIHIADLVAKDEGDILISWLEGLSYEWAIEGEDRLLGTDTYWLSHHTSREAHGTREPIAIALTIPLEATRDYLSLILS